MKRLFSMLVVLFIMYLGIQAIFTFFSKGESNSYIVKSGNMEFTVEEQSYFENKQNYYSYKIKGDKEFKFQINYDFNKSSHVIEKIEYFKENNNECLLPIYKGNLIIHDVICNYNGKMQYYYNIKGDNKNIDNFVANLSNYNSNQFQDNAVAEKIENLNVYKENLIENHYLAITNYKGINAISSNFNSVVYNVSFFKKDIYNQKLSAYANEFYLVADYNQDYEFNKFTLFDLTKLKTHTIISNNKISLDSYVQGIVGDNVYIFDKDKKVQYEINVVKRTIVTYTGNSIKYYENGNWSTMTTKDAMSGKKFVNQKIDYKDTNYDRIDKIGNENGYYYLYKKNNDKYDAYRVSIQNQDDIIKIFSTKDISNINYVDKYVYFTDGSLVKVFNDKFGVKKIAEYKELEYNNNFKLNAYLK